MEFLGGQDPAWEPEIRPLSQGMMFGLGAEVRQSPL